MNTFYTSVNIAQDISYKLSDKNEMCTKSLRNERKLVLEFTPQEFCVGGSEEGGEAVCQKRLGCPVYRVGECLPTSF